MDYLAISLSAFALIVSIFCAVISWRVYRDSAYRISIHPYWDRPKEGSESNRFYVSVVNRGGRDVFIRRIGFATAERDTEVREGTILPRRKYGTLKEFDPPFLIGPKDGEKFDCPLPDDTLLANEIFHRSAYIIVEDGMFNQYGGRF